jgi:hypothetical protein
VIPTLPGTGFSTRDSSDSAFLAWLALTAFSALTARADIQEIERESSPVVFAAFVAAASALVASLPGRGAACSGCAVFRVTDRAFLRGFPVACFPVEAGLSGLFAPACLFREAVFFPGAFFPAVDFRAAACLTVPALLLSFLPLSAVLVSASSVAVLPITASGTMLMTVESRHHSQNRRLFQPA